MRLEDDWSRLDDDRFHLDEDYPDLGESLNIDQIGPSMPVEGFV